MERRSKESDKIICIEEMAMLANPPNNITSYFSPEFKALDALLAERRENHSQVEGEIDDGFGDDRCLISCIINNIAGSAHSSNFVTTVPFFADFCCFWAIYWVRNHWEKRKDFRGFFGHFG